MKEKTTWQMISVLIVAIGVATTVWIHFDTKNSIEAKTVETLSEYFDSVDNNMSYDEVLKRIYEDSQRVKQKDQNLLDENAFLKDSLTLSNDALKEH